ncbi:hypothetical protein NDU88_001432 [Pleurodeles waltl]|uniref:Uncharacterized protein n=1 Tax=Pleurodeles waltl TaxID=8319 RepID=A0AAV7VAB8_PLEWA|nr:hypothetical protein NDU88_001432 [Pleurodeles waltl]
MAKTYLKCKERDRQCNTVDLKTCILSNKTALAPSATETMIRQFDLDRAALHQLVCHKARRCTTTQCIDEHGNKSNMLLYQLATRNIGSQFIPAVKGTLESLGTTAKTAEVFAAYYEQLYAHQSLPPFECDQQLLADIPISCLTRAQQKALEEPFTDDESGHP